MVFSKKWLKNHPKFLLHFLIHIDVLILCRKFELISLNNFQVMIILKNEPIFEKSMDYSPWFFQKMAQKSPQFLLHFLMHIDLLMLCRKFELILTNNFQVMSILKTSQFLKKSIIVHGFFE